MLRRRTAMCLMLVLAAGIACGKSKHIAAVTTPTPTASETPSPSASSPSVAPSSSAAPPSASPGPTSAPTARPAVTTAPTATPAPKTVNVTSSDNGGTIQLNKGDTLVLRLSENPSTGYHWQMTTGPDPSILRQIEDHYETPAPPPTGTTTGSAGTHQWTFSAVGRGQVPIQLASQPPGSNTPDPNAGYKLTVVVQG